MDAHPYPLLSQLPGPAPLREFSIPQQQQLCQELRHFMQHQASPKAGHIRSSLGVVELTVALHTHFHTPDDILIWDVGHQSFAHKIITGRREQYAHIRQLGGISGFTLREESPYDPFGAGHSSTALSAAAGYAWAFRQMGLSRRVIAVVGDGALTGGMALEALNYLGSSGLPVILILNDNQSSIDANVGALAQQGHYATFFEALGWQYHSPVNGHDLPAIAAALRQVDQRRAPVVLHVHTEKARGWEESHTAKNPNGDAHSFSEALGTIVTHLMPRFPKLMALSPAMLSGSGLARVAHSFPERVIDTGITEQHAVTMAAGMAAAGLQPLCHIYSTFAQRATDQIIHDVLLQKLPVIFLLDRAGLSGADGATHHGYWDTALLGHLPHLDWVAPANASELLAALQHYLQHPAPVVIRYPKAETSPPDLSTGPGGLAFQQVNRDSQTLVISTGYLSGSVAEICAQEGLSHLHTAQIRPFAEERFLKMVEPYQQLKIIEEHPPGGRLLARAIRLTVQKKGRSLPMKSKGLPQEFVAHGTREELLQHCGLDQEGLRRFIRKVD